MCKHFCRISILFFLFMVLFFEDAKSQKQISPVNNASKFALGAEVSWYPAGWLIGPSAFYLYRLKHLFFIKLGINIADRHNWSGLNDNEEGTGFGGSLGYRYLLKPNSSTFFAGTRGELYHTKINWQNNIGQVNQTKGTTRIFVYQPSIELGYLLKTKNQKMNILLSGGAGAEINIVTNGKPVGQGGMWLINFSVFHVL